MKGVRGLILTVAEQGPAAALSTPDGEVLRYFRGHAGQGDFAQRVLGERTVWVYDLRRTRRALRTTLSYPQFSHARDWEAVLGRELCDLRDRIGFVPAMESGWDDPLALARLLAAWPPSPQGLARPRLALV